MAIVSVGPTDEELNRRPPDEVLGIKSGPSRRGSTYWGRVLHCPMEHYLGNVLQLHSQWPNDPLDTGIIWHYGLEHYYKYILSWQDYCREQNPNLDRRDPHFLRGGDQNGQRAAYESVLPFSREPGYECIWKQLEEMYDVYFSRWQSDMWEIVDVETTLETNADGFDYSAKLDIFVIDHVFAQPMLRVVESKSTYRIDSFVTDGYLLDLQTMGQVYVVWMTIDLEAYPPFAGSYISLTSKRSVKTERVPFAPSAAALDSFKYSMQKHTKLPIRYEEDGYPRNYAQCTRRYGRCEFFNLCKNRPEWGAKTLADMVSRGDLPEGYVLKEHHT